MSRMSLLHDRGVESAGVAAAHQDGTLVVETGSGEKMQTRVASRKTMVLEGVGEQESEVREAEAVARIGDASVALVAGEI
mmetsp:Transcript_19648/g.61807  ORF Transcript_19648/g.61807 Transcript_19648/m.61807 type:complete len:80 (-) Transcript_19648:589-828(-)